jgi:oxaloacetate decarboxylase alpha subunit
MVTKEFKGVIRGEYGKTPMPVDPEFQKKIIGADEPITCRPADLIPPELETIRAKAADYIEQDEDVLSYALFEQVATKFFEKRRADRLGLDTENSDPTKKIHTV